MAISFPNFYKWYEDNKEAFDSQILPMICESNARIIGGRTRIMYRKWANELVMSLYDAGVDNYMISWEPVPEGEPEEGKFFPVFDWKKIEYTLGTLGQIILKKRNKT